jgi:hypothetical protein
MPPSHLSERGGYQKLPKISIEYKFNQKHLKRGQKAVILQTCHVVHKFLGHAL